MSLQVEFFDLSLVSVQILFSGILNCNKSHLWSLGKNIFYCTGSGYVSAPPFSGFSDLCCAIGYIFRIVRVSTSALYKPPPPSVASCFLGRGSLNLPSKGSPTGKHSKKQKGGGQTTTLALSHTCLRAQCTHSGCEQVKQL